MDQLIPFTSKDLAHYTKARNGEIRWGERIQIAGKSQDAFEAMASSTARFVLLGIQEHLGQMANGSTSPLYHSWEDTLTVLCNLQHNKFAKGDSLFVLGKLTCSELEQNAKTYDFSNIEDRVKMSQLVSELDKEVSHVVFKIIQAGKIPIVIGAGQNNAYGLIKGLALAHGKAVGAINWNRQSNFRIPEGRHSGNAFRYAFEEGFLKHYFVLGLQEYHTSKEVQQYFKKFPDQLNCCTYESVVVREEISFKQAVKQSLDAMRLLPFGVEIDWSACLLGDSPIGWTPEKLRQFLHKVIQHKQVGYLHFSEARNFPGMAQLQAHCIADFIRLN